MPDQKSITIVVLGCIALVCISAMLLSGSESTSPCVAVLQELRVTVQDMDHFNQLSARLVREDVAELGYKVESTCGQDTGKEDTATATVPPRTETPEQTLANMSPVVRRGDTKYPLSEDADFLTNVQCPFECSGCDTEGNCLRCRKGYYSAGSECKPGSCPSGTSLTPTATSKYDCETCPTNFHCLGAATWPIPDTCEHNLSYLESDGWECEPMADWLRRRQRLENQLRKQDCSLDSTGSVFFQNNWEPTYGCTYMERIGAFGDGAKWVCDPDKAVEHLPTHKQCLIYSLGSSNNFDFEDSIHSRLSACEIHTFDGTVKNPTPPEYVNYHNWNLGNVDQPDHTPVFKSLRTSMADLGHSPDKYEISVFKIDIEGYEFEVMIPMLQAGQFANVRQIQIEIHAGQSSWAQGANLHPLFRAFEDAGFVIFMKEPNTLGCQGNCIEYAFIRMALPQRADTTRTGCRG